MLPLKQVAMVDTVPLVVKVPFPFRETLDNTIGGYVPLTRGLKHWFVVVTEGAACLYTI